MNITKRKEIYDLVDVNDKVVGKGTYEEAKDRGFFTRSVHILLLDSKNRLLVCKRAASKRSYPNLITSSAGGHVDLGETHEEAAYRELQEELGIHVRLFDCGRFDLVNKNERTIHRLYTGFLTEEKKRRLILDKSEIAKMYFKTPLVTFNDAQGHPEKYAQPFRKAINLFSRPKTYVIDFDHTVFDWYGFKLALEKALSRHGVSSKLFLQSKDFQEERDGLYHAHAHLKELAKLSNISYQILEKTFLNLLRQSGRYIFKDAKKFLQQVKKEDSRLILLTYGDANNQNIFIKGTKVLKYFEQVFKVEKKEGKITRIKEIMSRAKGPVIVVNDDPKEALMMGHFLPVTARNYLVERPTAKFKNIQAHEKYIVVKKLSEIF